MLLEVRPVPTSCPRRRETALTTWAGSSGEAKGGVAKDHAAIIAKKSTKATRKTRHGRATSAPATFEGEVLERREAWIAGSSVEDSMSGGECRQGFRRNPGISAGQLWPFRAGSSRGPGTHPALRPQDGCR